jgi:iron complex outermembrane receptor protein
MSIQHYSVQKSCKFELSLALLASAAWLMSTPAFAEKAAQGDTLDEIVVTAQRHAEVLQTVPIAIAAFNSKMLQRSGLQGTLDLQQRIPSLVMTTNATLGQPYLRGVGTDIINIGTDPSIAVYEDGVYQARAVASVSEFNDVERVEVVMGPQGTLFGRNATGGALSIITKDPTDKLEGSANLQLGTYMHIRASSMLNAPVSDMVDVRVSGFYDYHDGYSKNLTLDKRTDGVNVWGARGKIRLKLNENLTFTIAGEHSDDKSTRNLAPVVNPNLFSPAVNVFGGLPNTDPREVRNDVQDDVEVIQSKISGTLVWNLDGVQLKSITAYNSTVNNINKLDIDATEVDFAWDTLFEHSRVFSQELQLSSNGDGPLQWVGGLYYLHESATQLFKIRLNVPPLPGTPDGILDFNSANKTNAYAAFGQASYRLGQLRVTAGLRYSHEKKDSSFVQTITDPYDVLSPFGSVVINNPQSKGWNAWTPKAGLDYFINDDVMLYVGASRGFKSGGTNLQGSGELFEPETLWNYEGGIKATWLGGKLRTNLAAFYYDYKNLQVNVFNGGTSVVTNVPKAKIKGFEANVTALPLPDLSIDLGLALLDAKIGNLITLNPNTGLLQDVSHNYLPRAPKTSLTAGVEYTLPNQDNGRFTLRGEMKYQSNTYFSFYADPEVAQKGYSLFNARLSYESPDQKWYGAVYGQNLTNKLYRSSIIQSQSLIGTLQFFGPPRTFGLEVGYKF